jgi:hypothetical protein
MGLPTIEAQVPGCKVMVKIGPRFLIEGSVVVFESLTENAKTLDNILYSFKENKELEKITDFLLK